MSEQTHAIHLPENRVFIRKAIVRVLIFLTVTGVSFFAAYGSLNWSKVWILIGLWVAYYVFLLTVGARINPDVVLERAKTPENESLPWDRTIIKTYLVAGLAMNITAGLDAGRYGWSDMPEAVQTIGFVLAVSTYLIPLWAILSNPFASGMVRIQNERGHHVIKAGPYRYIRHPMYLAVIPYGLGFPLYLGSWWALIPGGLICILFILRTFLEDRYLIENLPGYREYSQQVRFRMVPGIW